MKCTCTEWREYYPHIYTLIVDSAIIGDFILPRSWPFRYCPWCGKSLKLGRITFKNTLVDPEGEVET